jgi:hypothetical protein
MQEETKISKTTALAPDEVSFKVVIQKFGNSRRHLFSKWRSLLLVGIIGGLIGLAYDLVSKPVYTAECTFVLEEGDKAGNSLGQYSSLASMVGIDVGGSSSLFQGDNISQLYNSRLMLEKTLLTPANFKGKTDLLINRYIAINKLRGAWKDNADLKNINFAIPQSEFTEKHDSVINLIVADITKHYLTVDKPDKKLSLTSVKVKSTDPLFAKAFTESLVANVNSFYIQTKTKGAVQNVLLMQRQADSVHRILNSSIGSAAAASDNTPDPDPNLIQVIKTPSQRRQVDVQAATAIYTEVVRNLEIAKGSLQRETPLIQVIDQPVLPLPVERVGKIKSIFTGFFIAVITAAVWIISVRTYKRIMI